MREAARRLSQVARGIHGLVAEGRTELEIAATSTPRSARQGLNVLRSKRSWRRAKTVRVRMRARVIDGFSSGDGVVLDFGGVYDGYCVDLTRTLPVGAVRRICRGWRAAVREAHDAAIAVVRPGVRPSDIDRAARDVLARHGLAEAFGHGTGHGLGLEVHEDPRISRLPGALPDEPVVPGMVFTIEPGAYVPGLGGVRIEDDVLVVEGGCEVLTDVPIECTVACRGMRLRQPPAESLALGGRTLSHGG